MIEFFLTFARFFSALREGLRDQEFKALFLFVLLILLSGTLFYSHVEGWGLVDSLYFCVTTLATVGYGALAPATTIGKLFTIVYIFVGVGVILGFINVIAHHSRRQNPIRELTRWQHDGSTNPSLPRNTP